MNDAEELSRLVGDIYDAALDPALWTSVLETTCRHLGAAVGSLNHHDSLQQSACFYFIWNDNPEYTKAYRETYASINPVIVPAVLQTQVGQVSTYLDFISLDEYRKTRIYKEWTAPQGYLDAIQATLERSATSYAAVAAIYQEQHGPVTEEERDLMQLLAPHFRRAVAIGKIIDLHKVEAAALADTLDGIAAGLFLVDADGMIVHANPQGLALLAEGTAVHAADGRFAATHSDENKELRDIFTCASAGDAALGQKGIAVPLTERDGQPFVAHVLPLTSGRRRRAGMAYSAVAAVFVRKAALDLPHPLEALGNAFALTPAELRVLMMIVEVGGVPEVAMVLGTSQPTVRTHVQRVFSKTGVKRQADLVKLVAAYMSPLSA